MKAGFAVVAIVAALPAAGQVRADELQAQVLAAAKADRPAAYAFRRTVAIERTGQAPSGFVEQFDPRKPKAQQWSLASVDGRAPNAKELEQARKAKREAMPRYADMIGWFGAPAARSAVAPGRVTYNFASLPKGAFKIGSHDASADARAEVVVNTGGPFPFVERVRMTTAKPFRMMLVASVKSAEVTYSYELLPDGHVVLAGTTSNLAGSLMGKSGDMRTTMTIADHRPVT